MEQICRWRLQFFNDLRHYLLTYLLINSVVQSPTWEADWFAASQVFHRISRNPKVHYHNHKLPPSVSIVGSSKAVHIPTCQNPEILPIIIHHSTTRPPHWSLSHRFPHQETIHPPLLNHILHMPSPPHSHWFYQPHNIGRCVLIIQLPFMQSPTFLRYLVPPRSKYSPQHHILKHP